MTVEITSLMVLAKEDLAVAHQLRVDHPRQAAFHLQQAAEKLVKAVLTFEHIAYAKTHQLGALAAMLPADHRWRADLAALDRLTSHATALRYPMPGGGLPEAPDADELVTPMRDVAELYHQLDQWMRSKNPAFAKR